jgi:hypothetical protein
LILVAVLMAGLGVFYLLIASLARAGMIASLAAVAFWLAALSGWDANRPNPVDGSVP